jgi:hypothetical protein
MASPSGSVCSAALWDVLIEFHESPGRYAVARREPKLLFEHPLDVLQLAADRLLVGPSGQKPSDAVRRAARFFVRTAMLRPGGSHYDVLGVTQNGDLAALREHYRILIRLTHPDFSQDGEKWSEDAAARVNRAYDVLSSSVKRAEYDAQLNGHAPSAPTAKAHAVLLRRKPAVAPRQTRKQLGVYASGALAIGALGALALLWTSDEDASLGAASASANQLLDLTEAVETSDDVSGGPWTSEGAVPGGPFRSSVVSAGSKPILQDSRQPRDPGLATSEPAVRATLAPPPPPATSRIAPVLAPAVPEPKESQSAAVRAADQAPPSGEPAPLQKKIEDRPTASPERPSTNSDIQKYQPMLADLLHMLESGQSDRLQRWAERATQQESSAQRFASAYRKLLNNAVVTGLGSVRFDLMQVQDRQVIQGSVQIQMLDRNQQVLVRDFRLRANFVAHANGPQLASLDAE